MIKINLRLVIVFLVLLLSSSTLSILAVERGVSGDYEYYLKDNNAIICKYTGIDSMVLVSNILDGYSVTGVGDLSFSDCEGVETIILPDSVTSIGYKAFMDCKSLISVNIPNSVTNIGAYTFNNTRISSINIPADMEKLEPGCDILGNCPELISITVDTDNPYYLSDEQGIMKER